MATTMNMKRASVSGFVKRLSKVLAAASLTLLVGSPSFAAVSQSPLYLGGGDVPGNLLLVPSV